MYCFNTTSTDETNPTRIALHKFLETGAAENNDDSFIKQIQGAFRKIKTCKKWGG